jgi:hypothetical protein
VSFLNTASGTVFEEKLNKKLHVKQSVTRPFATENDFELCTYAYEEFPTVYF